MAIESQGQDDILEVIRQELEAGIANHLRECGEDACLQVDLLISSALRQLPPEIRAMPVKEAFRLLADKDQGARSALGGAASSGARGAALANSSGDTGVGRNLFSSLNNDIQAPPLSRTSTTEYTGPMTEEDLRSGLQSLTELSQKISAATGGLERMSRAQRNSIVEELAQGVHRQQPLFNGAPEVGVGGLMPAQGNARHLQHGRYAHAGS